MLPNYRVVFWFLVTETTAQGANVKINKDQVNKDDDVDAVVLISNKHGKNDDPTTVFTWGECSD
ncbi:hypothetical protein DCAR_0729278 [Daucus carota subsp. sativus]|uniref:Uncharacterized protein n=1 Tax=Daucus carota subsp. sativus TaxID=79200 RepID=A0A161ZM50_DAUCS|nr:hypothetical protein DCAR_0729278 [Daucus carota subsp. sativus]